MGSDKKGGTTGRLLVLLYKSLDLRTRTRSFFFSQSLKGECVVDRKQFVSQFKFNPALAGLVGVEREGFTLKGDAIRPLAPVVLAELKGDERFGYELSACQLEDRIGPCPVVEVEDQFKEHDRILSALEKQIGFTRAYIEVAPSDMPLDVYPDPSGRYQRVTKNMPHHVLLAACRVAGVHVHVGMPDPETAMQVYHRAVRHLKKLIKMGDGSQGDRMRIYQVMAPDRTPERYPRGWQDFHEYAIAKGFESDPRSCWHLIRISVHGTIEFRMFGSTSDNAKIAQWAACCCEICNF